MDDRLPADGPADDDQDYLLMVRDLPSDSADVYAAWADLSRITAWWGPAGFIVPPERITDHRRIGGDYHACLVNTVTGDEMWWGGEYRILDPPNRFEVTQQWQQANGSPVGPLTVIDVNIAPLMNSGGHPLTRMTLRQGPFTGDRELLGHQSGWNQSFSRLAGYLARQNGRD